MRMSAYDRWATQGPPDAEDDPDLITEAWMLCDRLWMAAIDVTAAHERRCERIIKRAEARLQRREFAELDKDLRGCDECGSGHTIQTCPAIRKELFR